MPKRNFTRNFQLCEFCPFKTKSEFFKMEHFNHCQNGRKYFQCNAEMQMYHCLYCNYNNETFIGMNGHIHKFHTNQLESSKLEVEDTDQYYFCRYCDIQTHSMLVWYKHNIDCCLKFSNQTKPLRQDKIEKNCQQTKKEGTFEGLQIKEDEVKCFKCEQCDYRTKRKDDLKKHVINLHLKADEIEWFKCVQCEYKTKNKFTLKRHAKQHLNEDKIKWFKCEKCDYKGKQKSNLKRHLLYQHTGDEIKWFQCEKCDYKGKEKSNLKRHFLYLHTGDEIKWFKCDKCDYKAKQKSGLKRHVMTQHKEDGVQM